MYKLVIADDEGKTTVVPLVRDEITIGRKEGNTIRLTDRNVSRRHAKLRKVAQNGSGEGYLVEDLKSYNGVKVNGRRVGGEIVLKAGDQITIGDYQLAIQLDDGVNLGATIPETTIPHGLRQESIRANGSELATTAPHTPARVAAPQPPARIVMTSMPAPGAEFALARPVTRIGRAEELDVWINHRSISREHAEITNDGATIKIRDLGSANGMRINGREAKQGQLKSGDTLELGQVCFRFVGTGEHFTFEFERHSREADPEGSAADRPASRVPVAVAAGIVGIAIFGAIMVATWKTPAHPEPTTIVAGSVTSTGSQTAPLAAVEERNPPAEPAAAAPTAAASTDELVAQAIASCVIARNSGSFDLALARASEALTLRPGDPRALECEAGARRDRQEFDAFTRGVDARERGDLPGAYLAFDELPPSSHFRSRPEVEQTMQDFASDALERAAESEPDEALRLAQTVLNMTQIERRTREAAQSIVRRLRSRSGARVERERGAHREREQAGSSTRSESSAQAAASSQTPLDVARECLARADNACVVRALEGRARNEPEWRLLIETYRAMSNTPRMLDSMERYIQRFPSGPRTSQYRQVLLQHGR